ncbi:hypothetical protein GJU40_07765 [Bacillus lacus]|uniref:DUF2993 domain-containing protein n=1 Tax=Metabacillus lacus TaxID=1983721 RepID=A0A7X2LZL1_9BACI|nr:YusW family protein [Metabacillus lacus]MRX72067.1 hypothetical protein [Metabacillus lacus]
MKKKLASIALAASLALTAAGGASAQEVKQPQAAAQQAVTVDSLWKYVSSFKGTVTLKDEKYDVNYQEKNGKVDIKINREKGNEKFEVTSEASIKRIQQFVDDLQLDRSTTKEEVISRLSNALGVKPSEVLRAKADIGFSNTADLTFSYKKGEKTAVLNPYDIRGLEIDILSANGDYYRLKLNVRGENVGAVIEKKMNGEAKTLKGLHAIFEMYKVKDILIPNANTTWNGYLDLVSDVLGMKVTDITNADVTIKLENNTKADLHFKR